MADTTGAASRHVCSVFESQTWRKSLCKHCFHSLQEHSEQILVQEAESVAKEKAETVSREHAEVVAMENADKEVTLHTLADSSETVPEVDKNKKISSMVNGEIYSKAKGLRDLKTERGFSFGSAKLKENVSGRKGNKDNTSNARPGRLNKDVLSADTTKIISKDCLVAGTTKRVGKGVVGDDTTRNTSVVSDAMTKKTNKVDLNDATTGNAGIVSNSTTKNTSKDIVNDAITRNSNVASDATSNNTSKSVFNDTMKRSTSAASDATTKQTSKNDVKSTPTAKTYKDVSGVGLAKAVEKERVKPVSPQTPFTSRTSKKQQQALPSTSIRSTSVPPTSVPSQSSPQSPSPGSLPSPPSTPVFSPTSPGSLPSPPSSPVLSLTSPGSLPSPPSTPVLSPTSPTVVATPVALITGTEAAGQSLTSKSPTPKSSTSNSATPKSPSSHSATPKSPIFSQTPPNNKPFAISKQISSNTLKSSVPKTRIAIKSDSKAPVSSKEKERRRTPSPFPFTLTLRKEKQTKETAELKSPSNSSLTIPQNQSRPDTLQNDLKTPLTTVEVAKISISHSKESKLADAEASSHRAFGLKPLQLDEKRRNKTPLQSPPENDSKESDKSTATCGVDSLKPNRDNSKSPTGNNSNELNKKSPTSSVNGLKSASLKSTKNTTNPPISKPRLEKGGSCSSSEKHTSNVDRKREDCTQLDDVKGQTNAPIKQEQSTVLNSSPITDKGANFIEAERDITRRRSSSSRRDSDQAPKALREHKREPGTGRTVRTSRQMSSGGQVQTIVPDELALCPFKYNCSSASVSSENQDQAKKETKQAAAPQKNVAVDPSPANRTINDKRSSNNDLNTGLCNGVKKADALLLKKKESLSLSLSSGKRASIPCPIAQLSRTSTPSTSSSSSPPSSPATVNSPSSLSSVNSSKSPTSSTPDCKNLVNAQKESKAGKSTKENSNTSETVKGKVVKRPTSLAKKGSTPFLSQTAVEKDVISCQLKDEDKKACLETKDSEKIKAELLVKEEELTTMTKRMIQMEQLLKTLEEEKDQVKSEHMEKENAENVIIDLRMQLAVLGNQCSRLEKDNQSLSDKLYEKKATAESEQETERSKADKETLKRDLQDTEKELEELKSINEELQDQIIELKDEMEEMYDHFRENDHEEFRDIQRELDMTAKNCRVLQLKLRKAERRNERIEEERAQYEERLRLLQDQFDSKDAKNHIRVLEEELRIAKGVSVRLHDELDIVEDKRKKALEDNKHLAELLEHTDRRQFRLEMEVDKLRDMVGDLKQQLKESRSGHTNIHKETSPDRRVVSTIFTRSID